MTQQSENQAASREVEFWKSQAHEMRNMITQFLQNQNNLTIQQSQVQKPSPLLILKKDF